MNVFDIRSIRVHAIILLLATSLLFAGIAQGKDESESMILASKKGNLEEVKRLLKKGYGVNTRVKGRLPLTQAAYQDHKRVVEFPVKSGADVNARNFMNSTALNFAALGGKLDVVDVLIAKGAKSNIKDIGGMTALLYAIVGGHTKIVQLLLKNGSDANVKNRKGKTALMAAAYGGHPEIVKLLLASKADPHAKSKHSRTAFWYAQQQGHHDIVRILKDKGVKE